MPAPASPDVTLPIGATVRWPSTACRLVGRATHKVGRVVERVPAGERPRGWSSARRAAAPVRLEASYLVEVLRPAPASAAERLCWPLAEKLILDPHAGSSDGAAIAAALVDDVRARHPDALVMAELGLCKHASRIDLAAVAGHSLLGFEIKSDRDSLSRLSTQIPAYGALFDFLAVVCGPAHLGGVRRRLPAHWGLTRVVEEPGSPLRFEIEREPARNPDVDAGALVQLLWREEALAVLQGLGRCPPKLRKRPCRVIWPLVAEALPLDGLRAAVRAAMRGRTWQHTALPRR